MCGIIVNCATEPLLTHRGPDEHLIKKFGKHTFSFFRLSINDISSNGSQPFIYKDTMLICNGEIYNHDEFSKDPCDCKCLQPLIETHGLFDTCNMIRGVFAIVWTDGNRIMAARDPVGVRPLFYSKSGSTIKFASEIKGFSVSDNVSIFPPGHIYDSAVDSFICYYPLYWKFKINVPNTLSEMFQIAVRRRIHNTDRPLGFFLSGGLDSSLVVAVARKILPPDTVIKTFSIGTEDSPDRAAAMKVAHFLNTEHHDIPFDFSEGIYNLYDVIHSLETYDTTTIRASVPMWLLSRWISHNTECRVLLSGEGSDELLGGYKYFKGAPTVNDFFMETQRRVGKLHQYDVLRADRCTAAHGLEVRVPFLDRDFIDCVMCEINPKDKVTDMEKKVLRDEFKGFLPDEILYRTKDAFSDAVGYSWVDHMKKYAEGVISDREFEKIKNNSNGHCVPTTKEEALYRSIFWEQFGHHRDGVIGEIWRPKWSEETDPSARKL
jgi:asparagine synthase (glutamine-hydrolysing)